MTDVEDRRSHHPTAVARRLSWGPLADAAIIGAHALLVAGFLTFDLVRDQRETLPIPATYPILFVVAALAVFRWVWTPSNRHLWRWSLMLISTAYMSRGAALAVEALDAFRSSEAVPIGSLAARAVTWWTLGYLAVWVWRRVAKDVR